MTINMNKSVMWFNKHQGSRYAAVKIPFEDEMLVAVLKMNHSAAMRLNDAEIIVSYYL